MKKLISIIVILFMLLCVGSCDFSGNNGNQESAATDSMELIEVIENDTVEAEEADSLVQCVAITKNGTQCQRLVKYPDTLCFQHYKMRQ